MEVRQIYYVLEVARQKNFSKAAQALFITQPTISQQIRNLEEELGVTLFTRDTHTVMLTSDGERFCKYGQAVVDALDDLMGAFGQRTADDKARLMIGVYTFYKATGLARIISSFIKANVNILCTTRIVDNYAAYDKLGSGELDFAIIKSRPEHIRSDFTHIELVREDPLVVLTGRGSSTAERSHITLNDLGSLKLTTGDENTHLYAQMQEWYKDNGQDFNISFSTLEDADMITELVADGFTQTLATRSVADALRDKGVLGIPIEPVQMFRTYLVYRKGSRLGGSEKAFIGHIKKEYGIR